MPLYEYICEHCGTAFEHWVRSAASQEAIACPQCQSVEVSKQFSTFGVKGGASANSSVSSGDNCTTGGG
ncbi:MAG TPA: zinc ribbon domain-containing protein [Chloroflexi bacterium]|nr:zinc ribbon domain-containing protein [Chloroflexota bacterium]HHW86371.1 zinc ribbon domain-containing protein [Chloroflexota bacterium]